MRSIAAGRGTPDAIARPPATASTSRGARGLTTFLYDLHQGRWVIGSTARAGGADPAFDPRQAYDTPILGAPSGRKLMGMSVRLSNPRISADGVLALGSAGELRPTRPDELPTGHRTWAAAHRKVRAALGSGLRRGTAPVPVVLSPSFVEEPHQDPFSERFLLPLRDATGATMDLCLDAGAETAAARLSGPLADTVSLLAEAEARAGELTLTLVSVMVGGETPHVANLALDPAPDIPPVSLGQRLARFADPLAGAGGRAPGPDPVAALARDALTAATGMAVGVSPQRQLPRRAETLGLASLAAALEAEPSARTALRCAYLASEVLWACGGDAGERDGAQ